MKKTLIAIFCIMAVMFVAASAQADTINLAYGDSRYVGLINDGIPSNPSDELTYVANLITLGAGATATTIGTETYDRIGSSLAGLPDVTGPASKDDSGNNVFTIGTNDPFYILGKYDAFHAGSWVWLVDASIGDTINLPTTFGRYGLSHYTTFGGTSVPEPATMLLFGSGLVSLVAFRKRFTK